MGNQVEDFDPSKDTLLFSESSGIISEGKLSDNGKAGKESIILIKMREVEFVERTKLATDSFGKKTIRHFLQERNINDMLHIFGLPVQDGFRDSQRLSDLIHTLIKDKRTEFTLGKGRKARKLFMWKIRASRVPLRHVSLFQLVCTMKDSTLVKKYLEQGVDVNAPIDKTYNGEFSGRSPLHLALSHLASSSDSQKKLLTVYLLIHHGANIHAKDSQGNTPLHALFSGAPFNKQLFVMIMENGADSNAVNNRGETAFELLIASNGNLDIENYIEVGGCINRFNFVNHGGCISEIIRRISAERICNALSLMEVDSHGRTAIHNIVSFSIAKMKDVANSELYYDDMQMIIESILMQGGDIDSQDESGKTPLHYAAAFQNSQSVSLLLRLGADMNICDLSSKSAMKSSLDLSAKSSQETTRNDRVIKTFMLHLYKLKLNGLHISQENKENLIRASMIYVRNTVRDKDFRCELEQLKDTVMETSNFMLHDIISHTGTKSSYPSMMPNDRDAIDHYFKNFHRKDFSDLGSLLAAQYQKAQERLTLIKPAANSFNDLIDMCLPDYCIGCTSKYLENKDLKNMIIARDVHDDFDAETDVCVNP